MTAIDVERMPDDLTFPCAGYEMLDGEKLNPLLFKNPFPLSHH